MESQPAAASGRWLKYPDGGGSCVWGICKRLDREAGFGDHYEPCETELLSAGLPWFYFVTVESLRKDLRADFIRESTAFWDEDQREP